MAPIAYDTLTDTMALALKWLTEHPEFTRKLDQQG